MDPLAFLHFGLIDFILLRARGGSHIGEPEISSPCPGVRWEVEGYNGHSLQQQEPLGWPW